MNQARGVQHCSITSGIKENYLLPARKYLRQIAFHFACISGGKVYPAARGYPKLAELSPGPGRDRRGGPCDDAVQINGRAGRPLSSKTHIERAGTEDRF
jgi:hypothetical protein